MSTDPIGFRGPQVCRLAGITYRQLDYWARTDLLRPSIADARGSGTARRYSYDDVVLLSLIRSLLDAGVSLQSARRAVEYLRRHDVDLTAANLVISPSGPVVARTDGELVSVVRAARGVLSIVSVEGIREELDAAMAAGVGTHARVEAGAVA